MVPLLSAGGGVGEGRGVGKGDGDDEINPDNAADSQVGEADGVALVPRVAPHELSTVLGPRARANAVAIRVPRTRPQPRVVGEGLVHGHLWAVLNEPCRGGTFL